MTTPQHEGATLDGLHVLTDAELERYVQQRIRAVNAEAEIAHDMRVRRQTQQARCNLERYRRYCALADQYGLPRRHTWTRDLLDLERRAGLR